MTLENGPRDDGDMLASGSTGWMARHVRGLEVGGQVRITSKVILCFVGRRGDEIFPPLVVIARQDNNEAGARVYDISSTCSDKPPVAIHGRGGRFWFGQRLPNLLVR
jgi:hypothetical protein